MLYISRYRRLELAEEYFRINNSWDESKHPRDEKGRFTKSSNIDNIPLYAKIKRSIPKEIYLEGSEYALVMHELNTNLPQELKNKKIFNRSIGNYSYKIVNKGFDDYKIIGKVDIGDIYD